MFWSHPDKGDPQEFLFLTHPEVPVVGGKSKQNELKRNAVVVAVGDGRLRINIRFPKFRLEINAKRVRRDVAKDLFFGEVASDESHG